MTSKTIVAPSLLDNQGDTTPNPLCRCLTRLPFVVRMELSTALDEAAAAGRLTLAIAELAGDSPLAKVAWQAHLAASGVIDKLAFMTGLEDPCLHM